MAVANESRYGKLNGSGRYAIFISMCNANVPYEWCRRSASAWYRTASGREDTTYARDPDPSGSPGTDSRPWAPSLGTRLETRPATVAAWTRSGDRLSARWQVVNWEVGCNDSVRVNFASEIIGLYSKSEYYEWPQVKFYISRSSLSNFVFGF